MQKISRHLLAAAVLLGAATAAQAAESLTVQLNQATETGAGKPVGNVVVTESKYGLVFTPMLSGLQPGVHGFHVHMNGSCDVATVDGKVTPAGAAGGHWDPDKTGKHGFPWEDGNHLGDLPALLVTADGKAAQPVLAPRLKKLSELSGHALMVHAGGDNHSDHPAPLGGGGARFACGVIK
ncbi:superoxide dismutase [Cu-Zn] SodC [Pseudomonas turukhanskensis]|uniref:Superoxide dismutase [Cu-Zn] n=1 Tax=Pseudomonas turukhanskensis TaxID=1806536 RepID=A0A9W6K5B7_9PSED|nr:superoxide dismutase [Cu-Zn] SodC [Pseudomonas turukhanskensis]GLK88274.1 superoxide dismutase [Cu-Zn] [Pseudomonas turukhanskensis]